MAPGAEASRVNAHFVLSWQRLEYLDTKSRRNSKFTVTHPRTM